jgi:hypothetical protein
MYGSRHPSQGPSRAVSLGRFTADHEVTELKQRVLGLCHANNELKQDNFVYQVQLKTLQYGFLFCSHSG